MPYRFVVEMQGTHLLPHRKLDAYLCEYTTTTCEQTETLRNASATVTMEKLLRIFGGYLEGERRIAQNLMAMLLTAHQCNR